MAQVCKEVINDLLPGLGRMLAPWLGFLSMHIFYRFVMLPFNYILSINFKTQDNAYWQY